MKFHRGTHRHVLIVGSLVIKIARVPLWSILGRDLLSGKFSLWIKSDRVILWRDLRNGVMENIREGICYLTTRHRLLTPVLPLIFVNLQPRVDGVGAIGEGDEIFYKVDPKVHDDDECNGGRYGKILSMFRSCAHTFESNNFAFDGERFKFVDYGEYGIKYLLVHYGNRLEKHLVSAARALAR